MPKAKSPLRIKTDEIRAWFANCDPTQTQVKDALKRAAKLIWEYQTSQEQQSGTTIDHNGVGYNGVDADFASRIVNWRGTLTNRMAMAARKMLKKYAKQLAGMRQTFSVIHAETLSASDLPLRLMGLRLTKPPTIAAIFQSEPMTTTKATRHNIAAATPIVWKLKRSRMEAKSAS